MKLKRNTKWRFFTIVLATLFVLSMIPSTTIPNTSVIVNDGPQTEVKTSISAPYKAALMVGGDETDLGFSYTAIRAIEAIETIYTNWTVSISKRVEYWNQVNVLKAYGDADYDVVFLVGGQFGYDIMETNVTQDYLDTLFVLVPGWGYSPFANVVGLGPAFQTEGMYLAGVLSGLMTETGRLAVVFGAWYDYLAMEFYAFKAGVKSVNNDTCVYARNAGAWDDAAAGKQITSALIDTHNVDIVVQVADLTGRGVISATIEAGITVIGSVGDQWSLAPFNTMTSIGMDTQALFELVVQRAENGTAMSTFGYSSLDMMIGNYLHPYHEYNDTIPQSVKDKVDLVKAGIANGSIVVPQLTSESVPDDPTGCDPIVTTPAIPGFPLLYIGLASTTMLGVMLLLINRSRRIVNKHKS
ncbi:hypothetical protein LCGC14_0980450 [marine sediment metagenome]|uniref:ABC transporter substrate-binding protein PnrA-like domain-containing protein n=1 Tax=marine sediment metagenome TaxID=412755 RepID=A0A0F9RFF6_9ZZZZ